ncbi:MAG: CHRD domain-containing protein, partial [Gemmatimonadales bacterium]
TNPAAGDYEIVVEAQTGPGGAWETGTGTLTILAAIAPSINVTSVFNDGTPNTIYQCTETGQATPFEYDFLLFDGSGGPMTGVTLENGDLMQSGAKVGEVTITGPEGATGQAVTVAAPSFEITGPVLGASTARLTAVFTAGSLAGDYAATFSLDGGNSVTMFVEATEAPPTVELSAVLDGAGEVPGPGDDDGSGTATVSITGTKVTFSFTVANIDMPTAAHIHSGAAGVAGGVVVDLLGNGVLTDNSDGTFTATGMVDIDAQLASDISTTPEGFYVNVHNAAFAPGAIRGNLGLGPLPPPPPPTVELTAMLDGASEYPGPGDDDGSGSATVTISGTTLTYTVTVSGIGEPTAAHIHAGAAGTAGPIAVDLVPEGAAFVADGSGGYTLTWTQEIFPAQASEMATNFANFYVNVHTTAFASGALRGQLEAE